MIYARLKLNADDVRIIASGAAISRAEAENDYNSARDPGERAFYELAFASNPWAFVETLAVGLNSLTEEQFNLVRSYAGVGHRSAARLGEWEEARLYEALDAVFQARLTRDTSQDAEADEDEDA